MRFFSPLDLALPAQRAGLGGGRLAAGAGAVPPTPARAPAARDSSGLGAAPAADQFAGPGAAHAVGQPALGRAATGRRAGPATRRASHPRAGAR